jgi:hypothetical protein
MNSVVAILPFILLAGFVVFHALVIFKIVPYQLIGGGRIKTIKQMYWVESVALIITFVFLWIWLEKNELIEGFIPMHITNYLIVGMGIYFFLLNTLGNIFSKNKIERYVFSIITMLLAICCFYISFYS